ncbi:MAG: ribonuclease HII [Bacteroidia bacterium]|nr:ribonuclease HII [Bacteroidia bacterium]
MAGPLIAGVDEAGRGCLAGPVVAAAVILPSALSHPLLKDSKMLTPYAREEVFHFLLSHSVAMGVGIQGPEAIDRQNVLRATLLAMKEAVESLPLIPHLVRIDGPHAPPLPFQTETHIGGDKTYPEIAAASIVAKVLRDRLMEKLHKDFPCYDWKQNKGYPTPAHKKALIEYGPSILHRLSFLQKILQRSYC